MDPSVSFSTVDCQFGFIFQAVLVASPDGHPVLKTNIQIMTEAYFTHHETYWKWSQRHSRPLYVSKSWDQTNRSGIQDSWTKLTYKNMKVYILTSLNEASTKTVTG
jgi:hypothetical protein